MRERSEIAILAGGMGTRLSKVSAGLPKPMVQVKGRPLLQHQIEMCVAQGFTRIELLVHHRHEVISTYFGDGSQLGASLSYSVEAVPRGTGGALADCLDNLAPNFLLLYGDTYLQVDLQALLKAHLKGEADATIVVHPNDHPQDSDLVELSDHSEVIHFHPYPRPPGEEHANLVNAALYAFRRDSLRAVEVKSERFDIVRDVFPRMLQAAKRILGYRTCEYIKDMGTPERLERVEGDILRGTVERLSGRVGRSAVFLDRDGTINEEVGHLRDASQMRLIPGVGKAVRELNRHGVLAVAITNQPVVARGDVTPAGLNRIHANLEMQLAEDHAYLDRIYYCPHHPDKGFAGEIPELKVKCECRKPGVGLIQRACDEIQIDPSSSWMIGDSSADILAGNKAGLHTVLVQTGNGGRDGKYEMRPDFVAPSAAEAIWWALHSFPSLTRLMMDKLALISAFSCVRVYGSSGWVARNVAGLLAELLNKSGRRAHHLSVHSDGGPLEWCRCGGPGYGESALRDELSRLNPVSHGGLKPTGDLHWRESFCTSISGHPQRLFKIVASDILVIDSTVEAFPGTTGVAESNELKIRVEEGAAPGECNGVSIALNFPEVHAGRFLENQIP